MKTWTNPSIEELEVKMTADGQKENEWEKLPYYPDLDIYKEKTQS